jgi:ABC-type polysaccharide/polyol phosphate transport system ATPase subunit
VSETLPEPLAIRAEGVAKSFRLPREQVHTLKEFAVHPLRRRGFDRLHALHDVSFEVARGESFGIVGRNGSGKSTLMKCLAGIYRADAGEMWVRGRLAPFIELGVGFNPELTARDNVLINGVMLGLTPDQARERYDAVIDFAELHEFQDLKLKNYSSGMHVRLAFAVMVHVDADVLLIDEVLAVGDAAFQQKCYEVLQDIKREGRTILLVTHDMAQVRRFCDRAMLIDRGNVIEIGDPHDVARRYNQVNFSTEDEQRAFALTEGDDGDGSAVISEAWAQDRNGRSDAVERGSFLNLCMRVRFREEVQEPVFVIVLSDEARRRVFVASTAGGETATGRYDAGDDVDVVVSLDNWFAPGRYRISAAVTHTGEEQKLIALSEDAASFAVTGAPTAGGVVDPPHAFHLFEVGTADLRAS